MIAARSFVVVLLLATAVWGQDAAEFQRAVQQRGGDGWLAEFLTAFLGRNHAASRPELSETLQAIGRATSPADAAGAVAVHQGDRKVLDRVLALAGQEASAWRPGEVIRSQTTTELWSLLYAAGPGKNREYRIEGYEIPEALRPWLTEEQRVNDKYSDRLAISAVDDTLSRELDPKSRPVYFLPHVEIPVEDARIMRALELDPAMSRNVLFQRGGRGYVRYFIHPGSVAAPSIQKLLKKYPIKVEFLATPTSSPRSLAAWNPASNGSPFLVKASLAQQVGSISRVIGPDKGMRATVATRALDAYYGEHAGAGRSPPFLREPLVVFPRDVEMGMIVRELRPGFPAGDGARWVPGSAIVSARPDGESPLLADMIRRSGRPAMEYLDERLLKPLVEVYGEVTLRQGLVGEPHQQNVLVEIGRDGHLTGRVLLRDLDSYKLDVELRLRQGLGLRDLIPFNDHGVVGELRLPKARGYYDTSYRSYLGDWAGVLGHGLGRDFSEVTSWAVQERLDHHFRGQIQKHLGIDVGTDSIEPTRIIERYRSEAAAMTGSDAKVSQQVLSEEFARLEGNRRIVWTGEKSPSKVNARYFLHDGAIEMRGAAGEVLGFALLEPSGARNFYAGVPHSHKEPDPARLQQLYDAVDQGRPDRARIGRAVGAEALGGVQFAAAYLVKEVFEAIETGNPRRMKEAVGQLKQPMFWGSLAVFTAAAKAVDFGLARAPVTSLARAVVPLAAGMAAVQALTGRVSGRDVLVSTGSFLAVGLVVNVVADALLRPAGWPGFAVTVGKLAVTLTLGEKLDGWLRARVFRQAVGVKGRVEALGRQ